MSVVIPAFNAAAHLPAALSSLFEQTWQDYEVVVVDDGSTDVTEEVVRQCGDGRVRYLRNPRNLGQSRATNRGLRQARGEFIKFLHADDRLEPDCLARFTDLYARHPTVGLAFARRHVELVDPGDRASISWKREFAEPHLGFAGLDEVNSGTGLFEQALATGFRTNWVGEPSNVMVRRETLQDCGTLNLRARQTVDMDLWLRAMNFGEVGFIDRSLSTYRFGGAGVTRSVMEKGRDWLDTLWAIEGMATLPELWRRFPRLRTLRSKLLEASVKDLLKAAAARSLHSERASDLAGYAAYRIRAAAGRAPALLGSID